jgi:hypothetical protein
MTVGQESGFLTQRADMRVGLPHAKLIYRRAEREAFTRKELLGSIPDYDYFARHQHQGHCEAGTKRSGWTEALLWKSVLQFGWSETPSA